MLLYVFQIFPQDFIQASLSNLQFLKRNFAGVPKFETFEILLTAYL